MNTIRIVVAAPFGTDPYKIDAATLNAELKAALGQIPAAFHNAHEAIVECDPADEATVRAVIDAHVANTERREHNKEIDARIAELERLVTPRRQREAVRGTGKAWLDALDDQIAALRAQRR